jgi:hypothetical protein
MASHVWAEHDLVAFFMRHLNYRIVCLEVTGSNVLKLLGHNKRISKPIEGQMTSLIKDICHLTIITQLIILGGIIRGGMFLLVVDASHIFFIGETYV